MEFIEKLIKYLKYENKDMLKWLELIKNNWIIIIIKIKNKKFIIINKNYIIR